MNDTVTLNGKPEPIDGDIVQRFITDVAKIWEKLIDLDLVKARWGLDDRAWTDLAGNVRLVQAVKEEMTRRTYNDTAAKERAQLACRGAPEKLENILNDDNAPPRNRIEASKELRAYAHSGKEGAAADKEMFHIIINLGNERHEYRQPIKPIEPRVIDHIGDEQPRIAHKETGTDNEL